MGANRVGRTRRGAKPVSFDISEIHEHSLLTEKKFLHRHRAVT